MPPAVIAAGIGAAASIGGGLLASSSAKKAANKASETASTNNAANNALALNIYGQNKDILSPFVARGNVAGDAINALLNLPGQPQQPTFQPQAQPFSVPGYGGGQPYAANALAGGYEPDVPRGPFHGARTFGNMQFGAPEPLTQADPGLVTTTAPQMASTTPYGDAFNNFLNSTGFKFQMDQGNKATNQGYAARGILQSGAALKALQDRGQQTALNNYFLPYMNLLGQQQGVGLSGASAVAGVGQNYAGSVMANNNLNTQTQLDTISARAAANQQLYGGIGGAIGNLAGTIFDTSYKKKF